MSANPTKLSCLYIPARLPLSCIYCRLVPMTDNRTNPKRCWHRFDQCCNKYRWTVFERFVHYYFINMPIFVSRRLRSPYYSHIHSAKVLHTKRTDHVRKQHLLNAGSCGHGHGRDATAAVKSNKISWDPRKARLNSTQSCRRAATASKFHQVQQSRVSGSSASNAMDTYVPRYRYYSVVCSDSGSEMMNWSYNERIIIKNFFAWNWTLAKSITSDVLWGKEATTETHAGLNLL